MTARKDPIQTEKDNVYYRMQDYKKRGYLLEDFRLFHQRSLGRSADVDYHYHEFCKLLLLNSGSGSYVVDSQRYALEPGDMVLIDSNRVHKPEIDPDCDYERTIIYIDPDFLKRESTQDCDLLACFSGEHGHILRLDKHQYQTLLSVCATLEKELSQSSYGRSVLGKALLLKLLVLLRRYQQQEAVFYPAPMQPKNDRILEVLQYLDDHICEDLEIDHLAEQFFISKYHLMRLFHKETGSTIHTYLIQRRLLLAREMIKKGVSATNACYRSGFRSYSSFTRAYSKIFGTTPTGRKDPAIALSPSFE